MQKSILTGRRRCVGIAANIGGVHLHCGVLLLVQPVLVLALDDLVLTVGQVVELHLGAAGLPRRHLPHLLRQLLVVRHDRLQGHAQPALDHALLAHHGHLVDQRHVVQQVAQVDEGAADEAEPGEAVVEGVAADHVLHVARLNAWPGRFCPAAAVVQGAHHFQAVSV